MDYQYVLGLMTAIKVKATRKKHANTLAHIQGYFYKHLKAIERQELCKQIDAYLKEIVPLTLIKHYFMQFPKNYLTRQSYLSPYPDELRLRYSY